jgi:hypothetical protein
MCPGLGRNVLEPRSGIRIGEPCDYAFAAQICFSPLRGIMDLGIDRSASATQCCFGVFGSVRLWPAPADLEACSTLVYALCLLVGCFSIRKSCILFFLPTKCWIRCACLNTIWKGLFYFPRLITLSPWQNLDSLYYLNTLYIDFSF